MKKVSMMILLCSVAVLFPLTVLADPPGNEYKLVWSDEFDGTTLNTKVWGPHQLGVRRNAFNTMESISLDGKGMLKITTSKNAEKNRYETGMIDTNGRREFVYGYFECRVQMQKSAGHWSAFWLMPHSMKVLDTPDPGKGGVEMDVFEYLCNYKDELKHNFHWNGYAKDKHKTHGKNDIKVPGLGEGFHVIGMEWTPNEYVMYCDGKETFRSTAAVSHVPSYVILSCEIGPWAGKIQEYEKNLPDSLVVDYVRVYQKSNGKFISK